MTRIIDIVNIFNLKNVYIAFFTNARFFAGGDYFEKFNKYFFSKFKFVKGYLLNSGEFSDTASTWPITFSIYTINNDNQISNKAIFLIEKSKVDKNGELKIDIIGKHKMRKIYKKDSLSEWVREPLLKIKINEMNKEKYPQLSSALKEDRAVNY